MRSGAGSGNQVLNLILVICTRQTYTGELALNCAMLMWFRRKGMGIIAFVSRPTISYSSDKFWVILNVQPQLMNLKKEEGADNLELHDFEKMDVRLIFSFAL